MLPIGGAQMSEMAKAIDEQNNKVFTDLCTSLGLNFFHFLLLFMFIIFCSVVLHVKNSEIITQNQNSYTNSNSYKFTKKKGITEMIINEILYY